MKITIQRPVEVEARTLSIVIPLDLDETPPNFPLNESGLWKARIDIDTGRIVNWPEDRPEKFEMHEKVVDQGSYELLDENDKRLAFISDYVPNRVIPGEFGDYIEIEIENGAITNWRKPTEEDLVDSFFPPKED